MKKNLLFIALCVTLFCGDAYGITLRTLKIKNDTNGLMAVSFGHSDGQLASFMVGVAPKTTLEVKKWDVASNTIIFVCPDAKHMFQKHDLGYKYRMTAGKTIDVKYQENAGIKGLVSNASIFSNFSNKDITVLCKCTTEKCFSPTPQWLSEQNCAQYELSKISRSAVSRYFNGSIKTDREALQAFVESANFQGLQ